MIASMGNKMCSARRRAVAERFTRPQRLIRHPSDLDYRKLRKLILAQKLAPCFDAVDDPQSAAGDLEECPICFLYYPSLNRSRCCAKGICTECFLQMKPSHVTRPAQCPYCKAACYAVEYFGARTEEEKSLEQAEEHKVMEARIRMQSDSETEERNMLVNHPHTLLEHLHPFPDIDGHYEQHEERQVTELGSFGLQENMDVRASSYANSSSTRREEVNVDFEEIMLMQAIWQSLQDCRSQRSGPSQLISRRILTETASMSDDQGSKFSTSALTNGVSDTEREACQTNQFAYESEGTQGCSSSLAFMSMKQSCMLATDSHT